LKKNKERGRVRMWNIKGKKIVVTGGVGFIGSYIVEALVEEGAKVIVYDNFSSGKSSNLKSVEDKIEVVEGDILDYQKLSKICNGAYIISHQAAQLEIFRCLDTPEFDLQTNALGTLNILKAAAECGVKKVINASSACVYGQAKEIPQTEDHPTEPNWPYGATKLLAEKYCQIFQEYYKIPCVSLRYSIVYGPREWFGRVLTIFIKRIIENKPPVIFGNGDQRRDFVYVEDVARMHTLCVHEDVWGPYNVSTGIGTSIKELAYLLIEIENKNFTPIFDETEEGKTSSFIPRKRIPLELKDMILSPEKARKLGWNSQVSLKEGVKKEIEWAKKESEWSWYDMHI
jgi:UDP-glucose 4-epimerase